MTITLTAAFLNLATALFCGALIGSERQLRRRMAGLRTNALVALGAAGFVVFSSLYPDELSPTRVGAQVVSGIGFLGAGIIFRNGFTVHGLNTAATLWCSAAVGVIAGAGALTYAILLTALVFFVNTGLRPLVSWIKRKTGAGQPPRQDYRVEVLVAKKDEDKLRKAMVDKLSVPGFSIDHVSSDTGEGPDESLLILEVAVEDRDDSLFKSAISPLLVDPRVRRMTWEAESDG